MAVNVPMKGVATLEGGVPAGAMPTDSLGIGPAAISEIAGLREACFEHAIIMLWETSR